RLRADIEPAEIRGNVDTRIRKVEDGAYDGAVLAMAGLLRLGLAAKAAQVFSVEEMLPAAGQAAMAVEVRADDADAIALVRAIDDASTRAAVEAERAFLRRLGGGCRLPVGAYACVEDGALRLRGMIAGDDAHPDGQRIFRGERRGSTADPDALGAALADELLAQGAAKFVDAL
ncbi:MAG: hydroxymethylbilane synthase, partial [Dehalococcoidia bacterium]